MNLAFGWKHVARKVRWTVVPRDQSKRASGGVCRVAFTLVEVVIVLVLVVILSGLAYNALMRPMAARRLQLAADQIRAEWVRARNRAMASGQIYSFQCELGGNGYVLVTYDATLPATNIYDASMGTQDSGDVPLMQIPGCGSRKELPEKITFADVQVEGSELTTAIAEDPMLSSTPSDGSSILFFPDGTTSSALITLENEFGRRIDISLRGLTGAVLVSELYNSESAGMTDMPVAPSVAGS